MDCFGRAPSPSGSLRERAERPRSASPIGRSLKERCSGQGGNGKQCDRPALTRPLRGYSRRSELLDQGIQNLIEQRRLAIALKDGILLLLKIAPSFVFKIVKEYITSYSQGVITELVPMNVKKMRSIVADTIRVEKELIEAFTALSDDKKDMVCKFISVIS